jgi:hypothetical protein
MEPDWWVILPTRYGLDMTRDLANPVGDDVTAVPGRFRRKGPGRVRYVPEVALGLEVTIRGGWYRPGLDGKPAMTELWSYRHKNTTRDLETGANLPPPLVEGSVVEFDPGDGPFGLYVANDEFRDAAFTEPAAVRAANPRLAGQPYKAMIYPYRDPATKELVPGSYLIGWEYSTNDDFQDVICRVENVELVE